MDKALKWFTRIWVALAIGVNVIAIIGFFVGAHSFWAGWQRITEIYSPFNWTNWFAEMVLLSPAVGAHWWLERRKKRATGSQHRMSAEEAQQIINAYGAATEKPASWPRNLYEPPPCKRPRRSEDDR